MMYGKKGGSKKPKPAPSKPAKKAVAKKPMKKPKQQIS